MKTMLWQPCKDSLVESVGEPVASPDVDTLISKII
jgi:hypothetical protein